MHSPNLTDGNIARIRELFPGCVTEARDESGALKLTVDFDQLKQELSDSIVEGPQERYHLNWPGKREALLTANAPIAKTLRPCREESVDFDTTKNLFIEGDNLDALKLLQETYLGKVKMIYIDPPYNTGNDFIYEDDFSVDKDEFELASGVRDKEGNQLFDEERWKQNSSSKGRFHSDWLSMLYPRLRLAKNYLSDDGVIFVSIDDTECARLKVMLDEVFGESNFIAEIIRNTNSSKNQSLFVSVSHEYCFIYCRDISFLQQKHADAKWSVPKNNVEEYLKRVNRMKSDGMSADQITEELKILTNYPRFIDFTNYWYFDYRGLYRKGDLGGVKKGNMIPLFNPLRNCDDAVPPGGFRYNKEKLEELVREDRIHFHEEGSLPTIKRYLHENIGQRPKSIMSDDQRPDYSLMKEFATPFDNPKQLAFIKRILSVGDKSGLAMDFFAGSSTTAHAVMQLNAEDGGNRKFIMVQLPEPCDEQSEAFKAGYKTIAEISKERIRRAGMKIKDEGGKLKDEESNLFSEADNSSVIPHPSSLDTGFRVLKIDSSNMAEVYYTSDAVKQEELFNAVDNIKPDRTPEDLLFQVLLDAGVDLSLSIRREIIQGYSVFFVDENALVACFDTDVNEELVRELAQFRSYDMPIRKIVFRDNGFASDAVKINAEQIFRQLSPETEMKAI